MTGSVPSEQSSLYCYRCGHLWVPKVGSAPKRCPRCHSSRWDVPERKVRACRFCGTEFRMESLDDLCPSCGRRQDEPRSELYLHCNQCDYEWKRRKDTLPRRCPLCHSEEWNGPRAERLMCQQCGYVWRRQSEHPDRCPHCQSKVWDQPPRAVRCQRCGHVWRMRAPRNEGAASVCPKCKSGKWNEPLLVSRRLNEGSFRYSSIVVPPETELVVCTGCGCRWYVQRGIDAFCPDCGAKVGFRDRVASTSMTLWTEHGMELTYVVENGYGCVYLLDGDTPVACMYMHDVLQMLGMTIGAVVRCVNNGELTDEFKALSDRMLKAKDDHLQNVVYFMKRLSLSRRDAEILALHFTGMSPRAIARDLSCPDEEIDRAFERIMAAYQDSGIVVDDTIFTEDPFRYY